MEIANGLSVQGLLDGKRNKMTRNVEVDWLNPGATKKSDEKAGQRKSPAIGALANENVSCQLAFEHKCSVDRRAQQKAQVAITAGCSKYLILCKNSFSAQFLHLAGRRVG